MTASSCSFNIRHTESWQWTSSAPGTARDTVPAPGSSGLMGGTIMHHQWQNETKGKHQPKLLGGFRADFTEEMIEELSLEE